LSDTTKKLGIVTIDGEDYIVPTKTSELVNDSGFISSETDPVYSASAAAGITSSDITNWNSKTSNTGTVTGVTAGTGLKVGTNASGGTISTSGTINHINSVTAKTTQGLYPIKYDAQGHITGSGDEVTSLPASDVSAWAKADTKPTYTATEVGAIPTSQKGANSGVAELDANGKVPSSQLPSYVDDVLEYSAKSSFPATGEAGKIYVDTSTNLTYRWSGSAYVEISPSLALGTTSSTAFRGDYGNTAYNHATDSSKLTTATSSGLYKVASTAQGHIASLTAVQKSDITALGIPAQDTTYVFDGTYDASTNKAATVSTVSNAISSAVPSAATATPLMDGTASVGTSSKYAKEDHVHPSDSSKVDVSSSRSLTSDINLIANISNEDGTVDIYSEPESGSTVDRTGITIGYGHITGYYGNNSYAGITELGFDASYVSSSGERLRSYAGPTSSGMSISGESETDSWASFDLGFNNNTDEAQAALSVRGAISSGTYPENEIVVTPTTTTIKNVVTPVDNGDAVPKSYVDNAISAMPRSTWFGTSNTAASTVIKVVTCEGFTLTEGAMISIRFLTANTTAAPVLNVNSTGHTSIFVGASPVSSTNTLMWSADTVLTFVYNGVNFYYISAAAPATCNHPDGAGSWYGTSSTAATTAAKVSSITNYRLTPGTRVSIIFSDANTYVDGALTLNINSTGAKNIFVNNAVTSASNTLTWDAGECLTFVYSGRYYYFVGRSKAPSGGSVTVDSALSSTSENPVQNKVINTALGNKQDTLVSGTNIKTVNGNSILGSGDVTITSIDEKVSQIQTTSGNSYYKLLLSENTNNVTETAKARKNPYLTFNPNTTELVVGAIDNGTIIQPNSVTLMDSSYMSTVTATKVQEWNSAWSWIQGNGTAALSDNKVAQNNSTAANDFRVLLSNSVSDSSETAEANKSAGLRFMPSTNHLYVGGAGQDALITVSPRVYVGTYTRYTQTGEAESSTSYGVGIGINNALAYSSYLTGSSLLFQHWNDPRQSGGVPSSTNYVDSMCSTSNAHVLLRDYSGKESLTTESELTSALLTFINSAGNEYTVGPTKISKWDYHTSNGNYSLTAATTQAVYPIKIDNRGHISAYGSAVTIPTASTATPAMDGTASYGSGTVYARSNHVHPTDTSRAKKANFVSFTVSNTTTTKSLTSGNIYLLVTKRMNNSAAGGLYIVAPHDTTGSVTEVKAGTGTTVSISKTTLTVTTTVNNIYCRLVNLNMPD